MSPSAPLPLPTGPFRPRPGVLAAKTLDAMALYDPVRERYLTLNPVATRIWELLSDGLLPAAIVDWLCEEYSVPHEQVAIDVKTQIASFLDERLLEPGTFQRPAQPAPSDAVLPTKLRRSRPHITERVSSRVRVPSALRCGLTIVWLRWLLRTRGFGGTMAWIRARVEPVPVAAAVALEDIQALEYAVALGGAFYPGRAKCLEQSLALYFLARSQGVAVEYCQGVQLYPFEAHAWIEYRGQVINDVSEHVKHFARFPGQLP